MGFIRVIITTNFDRVLETALADAGVQPTVISSADTINGMVPLTHQKALILKVNGDYLDSRIRNTVDELAAYEPECDALLDRVFDEFGLLLCGWSGEWDIALRKAIERCPTRRFSTYWCSKGSLTAKASDLIIARTAKNITIESADIFFSDLLAKTETLNQFSQHPLSARVASALVKRYIPRRDDRISLHDLVRQETDRAYAMLDPKVFHGGSTPDASVEITKRLSAYHSICDVLLSIIATGCSWGDVQQNQLWKNIISRFGTPPGTSDGLVAWVSFRLYPATLLMYAGGIAALSSKQYDTLSAIMKAPVKENPHRPYEIAAYRLNQAHVMKDGLHKFLPGMEHHNTPLSDHLFEVLQPVLKEFIAPDQDYDILFALFEYLLGVVALWWSRKSQYPWAPSGRCFWLHTEMFNASGPTASSNSEMAEIAKHLFTSVEEYANAKQEYDKYILYRGLV